MALRGAIGTLLLLCAAAAPAAAQSSPGRFWIGVSGGVQGTSNGFGDAFDVTSQFQDPEQATATAQYPVKTGALVDGRVQVRLWKGFAVGVGVTHYSQRGDASITARVPHPLQFNQFRTVEGTTSTRRGEIGTHLQFAYMVPLGERLRVTGFAGPSRLSVEQTFITDVQYTQTFPFDTATFSGATTRRSTASAIGFNAGADVAWMFSRRVGAGALVQYSAASVEEDAADNRRIALDAGGIQTAVGIRLIF
jgi:hypothetical protein